MAKTKEKNGRILDKGFEDIITDPVRRRNIRYAGPEF